MRVQGALDKFWGASKYSWYSRSLYMSEAVCTLTFLPLFQRDCKINGVHKSATLWLLYGSTEMLTKSTKFPAYVRIAKTEGVRIVNYHPIDKRCVTSQQFTQLSKHCWGQSGHFDVQSFCFSEHSDISTGPADRRPTLCTNLQQGP